MIDFDFCAPTRIIFGHDKEKEIGKVLASYNAKKVLIVLGQGSVRRSGLLDVVLSSLKENKIEYLLLEGVRPNPTNTLVNEGIKLAKNNQIDYLLAIGGGSVIDTAKSIAVGYYYDGDAFDFNLHLATPIKALPIGVILTISASGSEASTSCVIQNDETQIKMGFNSQLVRPVFAIENPALTYSVNKTQTAYGVVDIMMHTIGRYFQPSMDNEPCDGFAEALLRSVIKAGKEVMKNPHDYQARAVLMLMSSLSHNGLTSIGKKSMLPVHQLEHALSGMYPSVAHAAGLALLWPAWARYYVNYDLDKFDSFARNVWGSKLKNKKQNALKGIELLEEFFSSMNMPKTYQDLGIKNIDIEGLIKKLTNNGTRVVAHHVKPLDGEVARIIYTSCL